MAEKRYLKWYNKVGYGSGDIAGNVVYAFLSSFVMIYLTNTVGLNPGIVGTLIAFSKLLDGVTDIFFGSLIDKTHSKMGKARPVWLYRLCHHAGGYFCNSYEPRSVCTVCMVPDCIHAAECCVLHCQQHRLLCLDCSYPQE